MIMFIRLHGSTVLDKLSCSANIEQNRNIEISESKAIRCRHQCQVGTFAVTAIVDCRLSFANQGKFCFSFSLQQTKGSLPFLFSACNK
jgi:hypothetical protein